MKILFLHISDIHCKSKTQFSHVKIEKIVESIRRFADEIDEVILICSGDITWSGNANEFKVARVLFGNLISNINKQLHLDKYIHFVMVPGNHDLNMDNLTRNSSDILEYYSNKDVDAMYSKELLALGNFFKYANTKKCFTKNQVCTTRVIDLDDSGYKIQFNLINTAPFSTFKADSKEIHYLPDESFQSLYRHDDCNLCITVMHHSTEWFYWDIKDKLENIIYRNSDIIFQGHEHIPHNVRLVDENKNSILIIKGGEFSIDNTHASQYNVAIFDTDSNTINEIWYDWDYIVPIFKGKQISNCLPLYPKSVLFLGNEDFLKDFYKDKQDICDTILDYYIFPKLYYKYEKEIVHRPINEDKLFEEIKSKDLIEIYGNKSTGKTSLLKYLYSVSQNHNFVPLYIGSDEYKNIKVDKIIKRLFEDQFNEYDFEKFNQLEKERKILFIDDFDKISNNSQKILDQLLHQVGHIIFTINTASKIDVIESAKEEINKENILQLELTYFYKEKRSDLITKICQVKTKLSPVEIESVVLVIDKMVQKQMGLFSLSPEFIITYLKYFLNTSETKNKNDDVFNKVFETNINAAIIKYTSKNNVDLYLHVLEEIAYQMHFTKKEKITYEDTGTIIEAYNNKYKKKINPIDFMESAEKSSLLVKSNSEFSFQFSSHNYLAYFVAMKLSRMIEREPDNLSDLNYIIKNICFGINDTILLFLSYIRNNPKFIYLFIKEAQFILNGIPELNFDEDNIKFIRKHNNQTVKMPSTKDKENIENIKEQQEVIKYNSVINYNGIYDYNESDAEKFENKFIRAKKCIEIISKSLISLYGILESQEIDEIISCMYTLPNQLLFSILEPYDRNSDNIIKELKQFTDSLNLEKNLSEEDLWDIFSDAGTAIALSLYDDIAFYGADARTIEDLYEYKKISSNIEIQKLLMCEAVCSSDVFVDKAISTIEKTNDLYVKRLVKLIMRKHLITHDLLNHSLLDRISSKIYGIGSKKNVLLMSAKGNEKKV